ncbi:MAG: prolyl oligopeptidase family serine peptidase [Planctomycetota bacterium]
MKPALILAALLLTLRPVACAEDLTVLTETPDGIPPGKQLAAYLKQQLYQHLDQRLEAYEAVKSRADCKKWQQQRREFFLEQLGGLPERTPLNARIVGRLEGNGYRVEKLIFESRPGVHVTANVYLPLTKPPYPAVLVPCGHSHNGKAAGQYQRISILLAKHGLAALCYDPISQGERYQMLDYERDHTHFTTATHLKVPHPRVQFICTIEHTTAGLGCILLGSNIAQYRIWDGMRAIDYLESRDDIIADKIGCTGNSGGGTMTSYLMALDDRVAAAVPGGYLMTFRHLIDTKGPQDAEQNIYGQIAFGMDEADYVIMRAPKPTLICASTRDKTFPIEGTWPLFREAKRFYTRLRYPERVELTEPDAPHGFTIQTREATVQWMRRWLLGIDDVVREIDELPEPLDDKKIWELSEGDWTDKDLQCTGEGQVLLMPGEKSVFQLNAETEQRLREKRAAAWQELTPAQRRDLVRKTIAGVPPAGGSPNTAEPGRRINPTCESVGLIQRDDYSIEKLILIPEPGIQLPALAFVPATPNGQACLYLHGESMKTDAAPSGPIEALVRRGQIVLAAELRGIGETEAGHDKPDYGRGRFGRDVQEIFLAYLIGRSYVGMRTDDVAAWARLLAEYKTTDKHPNELHLVAIGEAAIPALHAAALDAERFASVRLQNMVSSWAEVVSTPENLNQAASVVHGALKHYDLPDLIELAGANKVHVEEPVDVMGNPAVSK